jgi:prepilin-type N-terminal cleavage/methylation domain-containing protein
MRSPRSAFTLIEVMLVVVIIGIIAGIAAPRVAALMPRVGLRAAARQIVDDVRAAQAYAADRGRTVMLRYGVTEGTVSIETADAGAPPPVLDPLPDGVRLAQVASSAGGAVRVAVFPSGYVAPHRVELESGAAGRMTVEFSGLGVQVR